MLKFGSQKWRPCLPEPQDLTCLHNHFCISCPIKVMSPRASRLLKQPKESDILKKTVTSGCCRSPRDFSPLSPRRTARRLFSRLGLTLTMSTPVAKAALKVSHELRGVVVSAGLMDKTVKVRVGGSKWNKIVHKVCRHFLID